MIMLSNFQKRIAAAVLLCVSMSFAHAINIDIAGVIVGDAQANISRDLGFARRIFEQVNTGFELVSLQRSTTLPTDVDDSNTGLFVRDSTWQRPVAITVWYVDTTTLGGVIVPGEVYKEEVQEGCVLGICIVDEIRYAAFVSNAAQNDTFARLIGLILTDFQLGPSDPKNLLSPLATHQSPSSIADVYPLGQQLDQITAAQFDLMKQSQFYNPPLPEPGVLSLVSFAALCAFVIRVRPISRQLQRRAIGSTG